MTTVTESIKQLVSVDLFQEGKLTESFVGRPFALDYSRASLLVADAWKQKVGGIPQGTLLLAFYENEDSVHEAILLRAIRPTPLPTDLDIVSSMIEYYKDNMKTAGHSSQLDTFTKYQFSFSGLECHVLGTFYRDGENKLHFGADVENFYSAHNYDVYKPKGKVLSQIVNLRDGEAIAGGEGDFRIGKVRYSSSMRFQTLETAAVPVFVSPKDFLGKRTALFGMTRTGKSNTVKKIIQATVSISKRSKQDLKKARKTTSTKSLDTFDKSGVPHFPVGQIVFDINGEYANANLQDDGTAIFELFEKDVTRYSVLEKTGFKVMKVNFYNDVVQGHDLICSFLSDAIGDYVHSFKNVDLNPPDGSGDNSASIRFERRRAAYQCCLYKAGFPVPKGLKVKFQGNKTLNGLIRSGQQVDPSKGLTLEDATAWFETIWDMYNSHEFFSNYKNEKGHEWADEDLKAMLVFLTRKKTPGGTANVSGYVKLRGVLGLHTDSTDEPFQDDIIKLLRSGKIVIVDLSQGDPEVQRLYSERICKAIFSDSMNAFIENLPSNFIQFYFEEAHNLFPRKEDKDLSQIYNRLAKEGAKLNLGLIYATQEVSSIGSNILKNTQNWFIAHLNNDDELREIRKYYDFADFADGLVQFSAANDKGFVRMKTYSNPFVVPVQIDRFLATQKEG